MYSMYITLVIEYYQLIVKANFRKQLIKYLITIVFFKVHVCMYIHECYLEHVLDMLKSIMAHASKVSTCIQNRTEKEVESRTCSRSM